VFASAQLEALVADLVGGEHALAELVEGADRITAYYHEHGYIVARAYIPAQEVREGALTINVQEGRVGEQHIENRSRLSDQSAREYLSGISSGDVLQAAPVDRALLLLNETPGVGSARGALQPGASVGTSDLVVELTPSEPYAGNIQLDNYGNYYTGENRLGGELAFNSPLKIGDQITLSALVSDQDLRYQYVSYQLPAGGSGLRLGGSYSDTSYRLGKELANSQSHGTATVSSLLAIYPFVRSHAGNLTGTYTWEDKQLNDVIVATPSDKQVRVSTFGVVGNHQDAVGGGGVTLFGLSLATGSLNMDETSLLIDELTANTTGAFARLDYNLNRLQRLNGGYSLWLALSGQFADKNLDSSEQFSLGGANAVRAYPQGEAFGDEGRLATVEIRRNFIQGLQGVMFYDAGSIVINHNPYLPGPNTRFLSGGGAGVNAELAGVQIKAYLAKRFSGGQPISEPATINSEYRLWVLIGKQF
jgi:hemolysin activation/secretion protein